MSVELTVNDLFLHDFPEDDFGWHEERYIEKLVTLAPHQTQFNFLGGVFMVDGYSRLAFSRDHEQKLNDLKNCTPFELKFHKLVAETLEHLRRILSCYKFIMNGEDTHITAEAEMLVRDLKDKICNDFREALNIGDRDKLRITIVEIVDDMSKLGTLLESIVMTENPFFVLVRRIVNYLFTFLPGLNPVVPVRDPKNSIFYEQRLYEQQQEEEDEAYREILREEEEEIDQIMRWNRELEEELAEQEEQDKERYDDYGDPI